MTILAHLQTSSPPTHPGATSNTGRSRGVLAAFSAPSLPLAALGLPLVVYMPEFYAHYIGLKLGVVGAVFMVLRLLDIGVDPVVGALMDATRTRYGRFKPWLAAALPILAIGTYALFMARPGVGAVYLTGWLAFLYVGYSMGVIAQAAWGATLSSGYDERSRIYGWWQGANVVGIVLVLLLPALIALTRSVDPAAGVRSMGWFVILLLPVTFGVAVWRTPDLPVRARVGRVRTNVATYLGLMRRPALVRILVADITLSTASGVTGALFLFFFREARGFTTPQAGLLLLTYFLGGLAGVPFWTWLARRIGKHRALAATCIYYAASQLIVLTFPSRNMALGLPGLFVAGLAYSAAPILIRAMTADAGDEARLATGEDRLGVLYALVGSTSKVGLALAVGATFLLLDRVGFSALAGARNSPAAIAGLTAIYLVAPVLLAMIALASVWSYKLDATRHRLVLDALAVRDGAAGSLAVEP